MNIIFILIKIKFSKSTKSFFYIQSGVFTISGLSTKITCFIYSITSSGTLYDRNDYVKCPQYIAKCFY